MNRLIVTIFSLITTFALNASISFTGNSLKVITKKPEPATGLEDIYILNNLNGVELTYTASFSGEVEWHKYSNYSGNYTEEVAGVIRNGNIYTLNLTGRGDMGLCITENGRNTCIWIVDYSAHQLQFSSLGFSPEQDCDMTELMFNGKAERIIYYTTTGQAKELNRDITLSYYSLSYNEESEIYEQTFVEESYPYLNSTFRTSSPLCNTEFTLHGDKYLRQWGMEKSITSDYYYTPTVEAKASATQTIREVENEQKEETTTLGGSAPCEIEFKAICSDAVVYKEWQMATDEGFENITTRINDPITTHTFDEHGTTYVRFMASNATGSCDYYSDTYTVFVGESRLECPNVFSPNASEGVNDEWKVSYKSITSFECHIFNRWGVKIAELNDPSQGWDGKYNGKFVSAGVYYYIINAQGADGKTYKLSGDINIINYTGASGSK